MGSGDTLKVWLRIMSAINIVNMPTVSALFFIRVRAIYFYNKHVTAFFGCCLLGVLASFVFETVVGQTRCSKTSSCFKNQHRDAWSYIATAVYDSLMYLSISWRLASLSTAETWKARFKSFFTGDGLCWLSKALLQSGQLYYL